MNAYGCDLTRCYFHPKQVVVGICSLCLRERLLALASKQGHRRRQAKDACRSPQVLKGFHRFFVLSSILHRLIRFRHRRTNDSFNEDSITSQDSFISIKFDGHERSSVRAASLKLVDSTTSHQAMARKNKGGNNVVGCEKHPGTPRWHRWIGQLLKLGRWKKERVEGRKGRIRSLWRRTTSG